MTSSAGIQTLSLHDVGKESIATSSEIYIPPIRNSEHPQQPTFLLLPFWGGTAETYTHIQQDLISRCPNNASIAVSYRGTGKAFSTNTPDADPAWHSIKALAEDLLRFLESPELAEMVDLSGLIVGAHSMSAKVTLKLASMIAKDEKSSTLYIRAVLLMAPAPPSSLVLPDEVRKGQLTAYDSVENARWTVRNVLTSTQLDEGVIEELVQDCVRMSEGAKTGWIEVGMAESLEMDLKVLTNERALLRGMPVRVLAAVVDKVEILEIVENETVASLRSYGFDIGLRKLEGCGHLVPVERPDAVV